MSYYMETKEYYTPKISDLFVGYECEILKTKCKTTYNTVKEALDKNESIYKCTDYWEYTTLSCIQSVGILVTNIENIRAHYLCKQDIIDLGFSTPSYTQIEGYEYYKFLEDNTEVRIVLNDYENYSKIKIKYDLDLVFEGICKSKNELKKLLKDYLNII